MKSRLAKTDVRCWTLTLGIDRRGSISTHVLAPSVLLIDWTQIFARPKSNWRTSWQVFARVPPPVRLPFFLTRFLRIEKNFTILFLTSRCFFLDGMPQDAEVFQSEKPSQNGTVSCLGLYTTGPPCVSFMIFLYIDYHYILLYAYTFVLYECSALMLWCPDATIRSDYYTVIRL